MSWHICWARSYGHITFIHITIAYVYRSRLCIFKAAGCHANSGVWHHWWQTISQHMSTPRYDVKPFCKTKIWYQTFETPFACETTEMISNTTRQYTVVTRLSFDIHIFERWYHKHYNKRTDIKPSCVNSHSVHYMQQCHFPIDRSTIRSSFVSTTIIQWLYSLIYFHSFRFCFFQRRSLWSFFAFPCCTPRCAPFSNGTVNSQSM